MKCQFYFLSYVDDTLVVCRYIQIILLIFTFMRKIFLKLLRQRETQVSFFLFFSAIIALKIEDFIKKPPSFLRFMVLIF